MRNNPLLSHLLRKTGPPALWLTGVFAAVIFAWVIGSLQPGLAEMQASGTSSLDRDAWLFIAGLLVLMGAPMMVGVNAAVFTVRHADPANLKKQKLANVSRADLSWGYFLATLHRMRVPLAMAVGLSPALAISLTEILLSVYQMFHPTCAAAGPCVGIAALPTFDVPYWLAINGLLAAGVVGFSPLGAAVGTWAGLTWKHPVIGPAVVTAAMATATAGFAVLVGPFDGLSLPVTLASGLGPYALTAAIVWLAGLKHEGTKARKDEEEPVAKAGEARKSAKKK